MNAKKIANMTIRRILTQVACCLLFFLVGITGNHLFHHISKKSEEKNLHVWSETIGKPFRENWMADWKNEHTADSNYDDIYKRMLVKDSPCEYYLYINEPDKTIYWANRLLDSPQPPLCFVDNHLLYWYRGEAFEMKGMWNQACDDYTQALSQKPDYALYTMRANVKLAMNDFDGSVCDFIQAIINIDNNIKNRIFCEHSTTLLYPYTSQFFSYRLLYRPPYLGESRFNSLDEILIFIKSREFSGERGEQHSLAISILQRLCPCPTVDRRPENGGGDAETGEKMSDDPGKTATEKGEAEK